MRKIIASVYAAALQATERTPSLEPNMTKNTPITPPSLGEKMKFYWPAFDLTIEVNNVRAGVQTRMCDFSWRPHLQGGPGHRYVMLWWLGLKLYSSRGKR